MSYVKNSRGGREVNMINTLSKIILSKIGEEGGRSTLIWIMSTNILFCFFFDGTPYLVSYVINLMYYCYKHSVDSEIFKNQLF